ncbi:MAG: hypothetical protein Q9165_006684 [Trypethelium subeluteriae]
MHQPITETLSFGLQRARHVAEKLQELITAWPHIPLEFVALSNEINDLILVIENGKSFASNGAEGQLRIDLARLRRAKAEFDHILSVIPNFQSDLDLKDSLEGQVLRERAAIEAGELQEDIRSIRHSLNAGIKDQGIPKSSDATSSQIRRNKRTPSKLKKVTGTLLVGYSARSFLGRAKCDVPTCRATKPSLKAHITYYFPQWFVTKAVSLVFGLQKSLPRPSKSLTVCNVRDRNDDVFMAARGTDVKALIEVFQEGRGRPSDIDQDGKSVLYQAMTMDYVVEPIFRYLLDCGSDPFLADNNDVSPYDRAWEGILKSGGLTGTAGEVYAQLFPSSEPLSTWGLTTLHKIVLGLNMRDLSEALSDPEIIKDCNTQDAKGRTPLWWAIDQLGPHCGNDIDHLKSLPERNAHALPRVRLLLAAGANPNIADHKGEPPLRNALSANDLNLPMIRLLASYGANLAYRNTQQMSALHVAARWLDSPLELLDLLATAPDWKRNLNHAGGFQSRTPLRIAIAQDTTPTALWLLRHGADPDPASLAAALRAANFPVVRALLAAGADLGASYDSGVAGGIQQQTILHHAAAAPNTAIIDLLASRRAARGVPLDADIFAWLARGWWPSDAPGDNAPESQGRGFARDAFWRLLNTRMCERCALDAGRGVVAPVGLCPVGLEWGAGWAGRREEEVGGSEEEFWEQRAEGKRWLGRMRRLGLLEKGDAEGREDGDSGEEEEDEEEEEEEERGRKRCRRGEKLRLPPHGPHLEDDGSIRHLWYDVGVPKAVPGQTSGRELQTRVGERHDSLVIEGIEIRYDELAPLLGEKVHIE